MARIRWSAFPAASSPFFDYTRRDEKGTNRRRLYFTEIDYRSKKRQRELSLSRLYRDPARDRFAFAKGEEGQLFLGYPDPRDHRRALLVSFDAHKKRTLWKHRQAIATRQLRLSLDGKTLYAVSTDRLVAYEAQSGRLRFQQSVGEAIVAHFSHGSKVYAQVKGALLAYAASRPPPSRSARPSPVAVPPVRPSRSPAPVAIATPPPPTRPGWHLQRDAARGYELMLPDTWRLAAQHARRFGPGQHSVPYVRYQRGPFGWRIRGSLHVLIRPAYGQDAVGLWRSALRQRRQQDPYLRLISVRQVDHPTLKGTPGARPAVFAIYRMRGRMGQLQEVRSLCLVFGGVAYEVKARAHPRWAPATWIEIGDILRTFSPLARRALPKSGRPRRSAGGQALDRR